MNHIAKTGGAKIAGVAINVVPAVIENTTRFAQNFGRSKITRQLAEYLSGLASPAFGHSRSEQTTSIEPATGDNASLSIGSIIYAATFGGTFSRSLAQRTQ